MSGESSSIDPGAPKLNLTAEEKHVYGQLFRLADTDNVGVVTGEVAVKFFEKTRLDSRVLGEIWQIADRENRGFLTPAGFGVVLRLIGHAQAGREPSPEIALQQSPIPRFDGFTPTPAPVLPNPLPGPPPGPPPQSLQAQGTGSGPIRIPPLTPEKVAQYAAIFERQPLQQGNMLLGDQARSIFEKSGLPNEVLGRIWMLADTEQRGALVLTEFVIAMHLLTSMKSGALRALPNILPAALYEAATRRVPVGGSLPRSPTGATAPISAIPRQLSGQAPLSQMRTGSPLGRSPLAPQATADWAVTPADKVRFDVLYDGLDKTNKGFITGEEAVTFFSQSKLPEDTLAQIWDLADFNSEGRLNKDQFAIAMYLIRQQRTKDGRPTPLPATLPPNLIPPSMRGQVRAPPAGSSPFDAPAPAPAAAPVAPPPQKHSALDDLFGLDSPVPSSSPAPAQVALATGGTHATDPFGSSTSPPAPSSPIRPTATGTQFKPFMPSSSFGRTLVPQGTGGSASSAPVVPRAQPAAVEDDLLGDNDPEISNRLNNETTELANLSNQIGSLSKQMQDVQGQRNNTQNELNQASAQKKNFEARLAQLRSAYEKEAKDVRALETQLTAARKETQKLSTELVAIEGSYRDLQDQHAKLFAALQADQQENASLKERIRVLNAEIAQLKPQVEKLKSENRQQKGLVAINKKQLATNEGERDKLKTEAEDLTKENEELARQVKASSQPATQVASPALSATSANNPFFRRTGSTDIATAFASPPPRAFNDTSFDDVFGPSPSFPAVSHTNTPPPAAAFKPQTTGTSTTSVTSGSFATPTSASPNVSRAATFSAEPPAPPESRQITPSHLPFVDPQESVTSSRQVSPPMSRLGEDDTPAAASQPASLASPAEITRTGPAPASVAVPEQATHEATSPAADSKPATDDASSFFPLASAAEETYSTPIGGGTSGPFGAVDQVKAKDDFESAFASFKKARAQAPPEPTTDATKAFASEFPPISELEHDDDSDSESDRGFDDDFAPASPPPKPVEKRSEASKPSSPALSKSLPAETATSPSSGSAVAVERPSSTSDKPTSPLPAPATLAESQADDIFGTSEPASSHPAADHHAQTTTSQPAPPPSVPAPAESNAFDDLDDDFEGLEDAKEGSADDDFANISRSGLDDFNPVFDSSPPQPPANKSGGDGHFGTENSFDFASLSTGSTAGSATASVPASQQAAAPTAASVGAKPAAGAGADAHDWDAIFASLDDGAAPPAAATPAAATAATKEPEPAAKEEVVVERPNPIGRMLTEQGVHDDPILKNLTSMGYSRKDALTALEKYDYNLERAANYLASQS